MTQQEKPNQRPDSEIARENRKLRWQIKTLGKQCGKQSSTIYQLRCEVAALRQAITFNPGDRARLLAQLRTANAQIAELEEKVAANEVVEPYHGKATGE